MVDWLYAQDAISPPGPARPRPDARRSPPWHLAGGAVLSGGPRCCRRLAAQAAPGRRVSVDQCVGPVRLYLTDMGVACAEEFGSDTARYVAAQRPAVGPAGANTVTIHGPASGVIVGSHGITQHAGDVVQSASVDVAVLARFAETVAQALPALALAPGDQQAAETLTGQIIRAASEPEPNHPRLRALGRSLRAILEGAAGNADWPPGLRRGGTPDSPGRGGRQERAPYSYSLGSRRALPEALPNVLLTRSPTWRIAPRFASAFREVLKGNQWPTPGSPAATEAGGEPFAGEWGAFPSRDILATILLVCGLGR